ncbi:unnamed protein product [Parascedosporium putredinis]|uniref:BRCT domain-containing protein n=1 Tax=Parascedosporium putredinis TaxID=1442378 RepID=A0A9P1HB89_9PEZI|nr:unnamed protein product [Parascedosporium putredinis]CAI8004729.1 unnamed protein product [Parascedosporium putredinis]
MALMSTAREALSRPKPLHLHQHAYPPPYDWHLDPPGAIFTVAFDDEALTLTLVQRTEIPEDEPISWMAFDHAKKNIYGAAMKKWGSYAVKTPSEIVHETSQPLGVDPQANSKETNTRAIFLLPAKQPPMPSTATPSTSTPATATSSSSSTGALETNIQNYEYQPNSGIHGMVFDPTETYLYSADLTANKLWCHRKDPADPDSGKVVLVGSVDAPGEKDHPAGSPCTPPATTYAHAHLHPPPLPLIPPGIPDRWTMYRADVCALTFSGKYMFASSRANSFDLTGYVSAFKLADSGSIERQILLNPTPTSGGHSNAVAPCDWSDEWVAITDDQEGWIEIYRWQDEFLARVARLRIPEPGFGMNAICSELPSKKIADLSAIIQNNGGEVCEPRFDGSIPVEKVTHIVSNTIDFPQYTEAQALMIPIVTYTWIQLSLAKSRLAQIRPFSPDPRMIFSSVVITCAGLPVTDRESIIGATAALGAWTPLIFAAARFDDCFKLGKRIDESPYLLPNAAILDANSNEFVELPSSQHLEGASSARPAHLLPPTQSSAREPLTVFKNKTVMLADDLALTSRLRTIIEEVITASNGDVTTTVDECNMFICQYRDGEDYVRAARLCKDVGNLAWLYHLLTTDQWSSPLRRLLHYPIPKNGIPGFEGFKITLSNYGGEARTYLENLIKASGATYTKTMKAENTHLITARDNSEKCEAAADWGISMVNHLWVEESYAKCAVQPCSNKKYTHFLAYESRGKVLSGRRRRSPRSAQRRRQILDTAQAYAYDQGPAEGVAIGADNVKVWREEAAREAAKPETPAPKKRYVASGKENDESLLSTGGRSAKSKAAATLRLLATDMEQYEKEKKRHSKDGRGPWGGKRAADQLDMAVDEEKDAEKEKEKTKRGKRGAKVTPTAEVESEEEVEADDGKPSKKKRKIDKPYNMTVTITGYSRWVDGVKKEDKDRMKLAELGIRVLPENSACQYLVAPRVLRTIKFLCGLIRGATVISTEFIDHVLTSKEIVDPNDFILVDKEGEKMYNMKLSTSVARARANSGKLLQGVPIYCTPHIRHGAKTYETIARACHAIWKTYDGKHSTIKKTTREEDGGLPPDPVYLLTSSTPAEKELFPKFIKMAEDGNMEPRIVSPDWLLQVCMKQEVKYDKQFAAEGMA